MYKNVHCCSCHGGSLYAKHMIHFVLQLYYGKTLAVVIIIDTVAICNKCVYVKLALNR